MKKLLVLLLTSVLLFSCSNGPDSKLPLLALSLTNGSSQNPSQPGESNANVPVFSPIGGFYKESLGQNHRKSQQSFSERILKKHLLEFSARISHVAIT